MARPPLDRLDSAEFESSYIVDFEDVEHDTEMAAEGFFMDPLEELMAWQLISTSSYCPLVEIYSKGEFIQYWKDHMNEHLCS